MFNSIDNGRAAVPALSLIALVSALAAPPAAAQTTLLVTGSRDPTAPERLAGDVVVIDRERLRTTTADSIEDLLRREAGLQLSRSGPPGANAGLFVRGANSGHTLVLVDGVRIGAATAGLPELEALGLGAVDRIEVLRGPGSSLYGADAVGGVVQIFTRRGGGTARVHAQAAAGGYGAREGSLSAQGTAGPLELAASVFGERNRGVSALRPGDAFGNHNPDRDGFSRRGAQARVAAAVAPGQRLALGVTATRLDARYDASEFLPPDYAPDNRGDFRNRNRLDIASVSHDARWSDSLETHVQLSGQRGELDSGATVVDHFGTRRRAADAQLTWKPLDGQSLSAVLMRLREQARSSAYAAEVSRDTDAVALAWNGRFGPASVQAEARHDRIGGQGGVDTGRIGLAWTLAGGLRLRALAGSTFKAPSFNDLFYPGYGVPTVGPERGRSVEAGVDWRGAAADAALTVYRNRVRDLIAFEGDRRLCPPSADYDFGCARNIGRARLQGASLGAGWRGGAWSLRGSADFLDARDLASGQRLTRRAAHQQALTADWRQGGWTVGAELLRVGDRPEGGRMLAGYTTVDLRLQWRFMPGWSLQAKVLNLGDRDVEPALDYRSLGRQAWIGLRWEGPAP